MAQIIGQIESLRRLKKELNRHGITRFNSIGSIRRFSKNYASEKQAIFHETEQLLNEEVAALRTAYAYSIAQHQQAKQQWKESAKKQLAALQEQVILLQGKEPKTNLGQAFSWIQRKSISYKLFRLERKIERSLTQQRSSFLRAADATKLNIEQLTQNREKVIAKRCKPQLQALSHTRQVVENLQPLIAGAIGEGLVLKELKKLPDTYIVINDYSARFNPPIYNRQENDKIFSIQVDHLVICPAGVFILETKNWSKASIQNLDLRSPIQQIKRTSFALFVMLNGGSKHDGLNLQSHHWGKKSIPLKNVVVMIHHKPKGSFKYAHITRLDKLLDYLNYFEPEFTFPEVKTISDYLMLNR